MMLKFHLLYQLALMGALDTVPQMAREGSRLARWRQRTVGSSSAGEGILEAVLERYRSDPNFQRIVLAGCDERTQQHAEFFAPKEFYSIDPDARRAPLGAPRHQVSPIRHIATLLPDGTADAIVCNGLSVFCSEHPAQDFNAAYRMLRPGGDFVIALDGSAASIAPALSMRQLAAEAGFEAVEMCEAGAPGRSAQSETYSHVYRKPYTVA